MTRFPISFQQNMSLKRGTWTPEEDRRLVAYIKNYGIWNWNEMPKYAGLLRSGKSCRLRWMNYLRPGIKRGNFTKEEEETIIRLHKILGNRWSEIAQRMSQRTDNEIKNYWNTRLKKIAAEKENIDSKVEDEDRKPKIDSLIIIDDNEYFEKCSHTLSLEVEDYVSSPESTVLNSPATGSDTHDFQSVFIKEENAENPNFDNVYGGVLQGLWEQQIVEVDNDFMDEFNEANFMENVYGEALLQGSWEQSMLEEVVKDNSQNLTMDEDSMIMRAPPQQLWLYESTVLSGSYNPDDFWSSASI